MTDTTAGSRELAGRVAAVTGAGAGLGRATSLALAAAGAAIVCNDLDGQGARATCRMIEEAGGSAVAVVGDAGTADVAAALASTAVERFGGLDILHANAAISIYAALDEMPLDVLQSILDTNLKGPLLCARAAIESLRARRGSSITFVSSVQAFQGLPGCVPYAAAKAGLVAATRVLAVELGPYGIRVNAIAPGTIDTPMLQRDLSPMNVHDRADFTNRVNAASALGRIGRAEEVAAAAVYLASDRASYVTGTCLVVDGGFLAVKSI